MRTTRSARASERGPAGNGNSGTFAAWILHPWWTKALWLCPEVELEAFSALLGEGAPCIDPAWGLERIIGHLLGMGVAEMTPFAAH
jgi:hypothetical protein